MSKLVEISMVQPIAPSYESLPSWQPSHALCCNNLALVILVSASKVNPITSHLRLVRCAMLCLYAYLTPHTHIQPFSTHCLLPHPSPHVYSISIPYIDDVLLPPSAIHAYTCTHTLSSISHPGDCASLSIPLSWAVHPQSHQKIHVLWMGLGMHQHILHFNTNASTI